MFEKSSFHAVYTRAKALFIVALILTLGYGSAEALFEKPRAFRQLDEAKLKDTIAEFMGTPYRWGGTTKSGIDCSGLVGRIYEAQGIHLPRTSRGLYRVGEAVRKDRLSMGDLVFFNTSGSGVSHVGVYMGGGRFIHSGTSRGVSYAGLSDSYWRNKYIGAKRIASGSTYTLPGTVIGATAGERVIAVPTYPFIDYQLVDVPTNSVGEWRSWSLQFSTNSVGALTLTPQVSFFDRIQLGGELKTDDVLGSGYPDMERPDGFAKLRINNEWWFIPGFAIGYDTRQTEAERSDLTSLPLDASTTIDGRRRGLFVVGSGSWVHGFGPWIGRGRFHAGGSLHRFTKTDWRDNVSFFVAYDQQILRRLQLIGEIDNIAGTGGWHINTGVKLSITEGAVVEYGLRFINKTDARVDKLLRFSYNLTF